MYKSVLRRSCVMQLFLLALGSLFLASGMRVYAANDCQLLAGRNPSILQNGKSLTWYVSDNASYTQTCNQMKGTITCNNGIVTNGNTYTHQTCTNHTRNNCSSPISATHLANKTLYKSTQATYTQSCAQLGSSFQCLNGSFSWQNVQLYPYGTCTDPTWSPCIDIWTNTYFSHWSPLVTYTQSNWVNCSLLKKTLTCINGTWSGGSQSQLFPSCTQTTAQANNWNCTVFSWVALASGQSTYGYSTIQWAITGQDYPNGCAPFSGKLTCVNGMVQWNPSFYRYTLNQCQTLWSPKSCTLANFPGFYNGVIKAAYLATGAYYPHSCNDVKTTLKCVNGNIQGNWQTYIYPLCTQVTSLQVGKDIALEATANMQTQGTGMLSQWSSPMLSLVLRNNGTVDINTNVPAGMVSCTWKEQSIPLYSSPAMDLVINPWTKIAVNIKLSSLLTKSLGVKTVVCSLALPAALTPDIVATNNSWSGAFEIVTSSRFDIAMEESVNSIKKNLEAPEVVTWAQGVQSFIFTETMAIALPLVVVLGILIITLWFYKIMFSSDEKSAGNGAKFISYGVIGIILIVSAKYIGSSIINVVSNSDIQWWQVAQGIYDQVAFPFIKFVMYLLLGIMFIILLSRVVTFIFGSDTDTKKKAWTLIGWNIISMLVIIWAKQIVEAVYGKQADITKSISNLWEIGGWILANKNIPLIYHVINWVLGLTSLVLLILIIVQTLQLLFNPDDEKQMTSVKKTLLYMFVGLIIIGSGYLIVNFLVIN